MAATATVVLIHGIGSQQPGWSGEFRSALNAELGAAAAQTAIIDAYWAPLSTIEETFRPSLAATRIGGANIEDDTYSRTARDYVRLLATDAGAPSEMYAFGPSDLLSFVKKTLGIAEDIIADVGNYVARNGVRTAVQNVLHEALGAAHAIDPSSAVLLVSHSQGTIISYDVLRQAGQNYPGVRTWITMGCPLRKYCMPPLLWGKKQLGVEAPLRWLNLYDSHDIVGRDLAGLFDWSHPQPQDQQVDNVGKAGGAHDHWSNPQVVHIVADEVRALLAAH